MSKQHAQYTAHTYTHTHTHTHTAQHGIAAHCLCVCRLRVDHASILKSELHGFIMLPTCYVACLYACAQGFVYVHVGKCVRAHVCVCVCRIGYLSEWRPPSAHTGFLELNSAAIHDLDLLILPPGIVTHRSVGHTDNTSQPGTTVSAVSGSLPSTRPHTTVGTQPAGQGAAATAQPVAASQAGTGGNGAACARGVSGDGGWLAGVSQLHELVLSTVTGGGSALIPLPATGKHRHKRHACAYTCLGVDTPLTLPRSLRTAWGLQ